MSIRSPAAFVTASAPGKVILVGEHAINRGQPALSVSIGLYARCRVAPLKTHQFRLHSGKERATVGHEDLTALRQWVERQRAAEAYSEIQALAARDYFAPAKYILALMLEHGLPTGLSIAWASEIPTSSGLGSGGAAFTALVAAAGALLPEPPRLEQCAAWAHCGDIIAHGGIASALDTQTSLLGGVLRVTSHGLAQHVPAAPGLALIVGNTGVIAATSAVNGRVRRWLSEAPDSRMAYFQTIGTLARLALPLLEAGAWQPLGHLLNLNQLILEKIGVSCPEIDQLIAAALGAGACGAKLSGSGGGGIIIALVLPEQRQDVAAAIAAAGGSALMPAINVPGVTIQKQPSSLRRINQ
ncbi:MAG: mevalonate kinase [Herpetosiphonaceae bacterium]|nr:mevalonate kinase [Herpetosiphonaceae bacterium]